MHNKITVTLQITQHNTTRPLPVVVRTRVPQHCSAREELCTYARQTPGAGQGTHRSTSYAITLAWAPEVLVSGLVHLYLRSGPRFTAGYAGDVMWRGFFGGGGDIKPALGEA